ncbi:MAG: GNAT family N-acetyltransferase [Nitrospirae bacterium]|nr:GNAT family N-acetyltransferase [Nitrospirota bacterium]
MITYRQISTHDREYAVEKELRNRVLRKPLGLMLSEQDLQGEDEQAHLVAMDGTGTVVGCVLIAFTEKGAKIRQIAIEERYRGRGIGTKLMKGAEQIVRDRDLGAVTLHARQTARRFFEKLGYAAVSDVFIEVTIPHVKMEKILFDHAS